MHVCNAQCQTLELECARGYCSEFMSLAMQIRILFRVEGLLQYYVHKSMHWRDLGSCLGRSWDAFFPQRFNKDYKKKMELRRESIMMQSI